METAYTLMNEHMGILAVLDEAQRAASAAAKSAPVPVDIFTDIREFFAIFVDRCHHGKEEDELFPRLVQMGEGSLADELLREHGEGRALAAAFAATVDAYVPGESETGIALQHALESYSSFLREHISTETSQLFPLLEMRLASADEEIIQAFERIEVEKIGAGTHERLHHMIEGLPGRIAAFTHQTIAP